MKRKQEYLGEGLLSVTDRGLFFMGKSRRKRGYSVGRRGGVIRICALDIRICVLSCINSQMG